MIEWTTWLGITVGFAAGLLHASMLWRASHRLTRWAPLLGLLRLGVVAAVLVIAACYGEILSAAGGWVTGLFARVVWLLVHPPKPATASPAASCGE